MCAHISIQKSNTVYQVIKNLKYCCELNLRLTLAFASPANGFNLWQCRARWEGLKCSGVNWDTTQTEQQEHTMCTYSCFLGVHPFGVYCLQCVVLSFLLRHRPSLLHFVEREGKEGNHTLNTLGSPDLDRVITAP